MRRQAKAHINFDHLQGYFGNSSFEATALGLVNIVNLPKPAHHDAIKDAWQSDTIPPWILASDMEEVEAAIRQLLEHPGSWEERARAHYWWHEDHFKPEEIVERLFMEAAK